MSGVCMDDKRLWELYGQERDKGNYLPDADEDYRALESAIKIRMGEKSGNSSVPYFSGPID